MTKNFMADIVNLTPHSVTFVAEDGTVMLSVTASGKLARVTAHTVPMHEVVNGIPVTTTEYGAVTGLPAPQDGTVYIVSSLVAQRVPDRADVFIPNESVRDSEGRIIGCRSLGHI